MAVGLNLALEEQWRHVLPGGMFATPVNAVASGRLMGYGFWLLASPDGTLHFASSDGKLYDQFRYGAMIRGMTILPDGRFLVTTKDGVDCWTLAPPQ